MFKTNALRSRLARRAAGIAGASAAAAGLLLGLATPASASDFLRSNFIQVCASGAGPIVADVAPSGYLAGHPFPVVDPGQCTGAWVSADGPRELDVYRYGAVVYRTWWDGTYPLYITV